MAAFSMADDVIDDGLCDILEEFIDFNLWFFTNPIDQYSKVGVGRKKLG